MLTGKPEGEDVVFGITGGDPGEGRLPFEDGQLTARGSEARVASQA